MTERQSVLLAALLHLALVAALSLGFVWQQPVLPPAEEAVPVDIVDIADVPRTPVPPAPSREAAPQATDAPPPAPDPAPAPPEAAPPPPTAKVPLPDTKPEPPKPTPKPTKPAPTAKPLDTSQLANLIDKALPKAKTKPLDTSKLAETIAAAVPKTAVVDPRAAATLAQAIRAQVAPCWNPPIGGSDVRKMTVLIHAEFGRDGRVIGTPSLVAQPGATTGNADYARAFRDTAIRAVLRCQPLKLPPKLYDLWKSVDINFDPESMT
ncbi:hypothetical protein IP88_11325 [alpha proteobacterium AAP81b]|nr:hypothetical protein IP88_11325 [alpha proteobacterium AAP81b]